MREQVTREQVTREQVTAVILAGGESRRMGTDKAGLDMGGMTLLEHTANAAQSADLPVLIAGRSRSGGWPLSSTLFIADATPGLGPLGGLATALRHTQTPVLVLACDLPRLTTEAIRWLAGLKARLDKHGLVVVNHGQWEPLFSIYRPECLPLIESRLAAGKRSLHGLIEAGEFAFVDAPDWVASQLLNVNTPDDLAQARKSGPNTPPSVL